MGTVESLSPGFIRVLSHIVTYGSAADEDVTERMRHEIETMWNEPMGTVFYLGRECRVAFRITAECRTNIDPLEILSNTDPANNYFRIEEFATGNISFVDGLGSNTGYFKLENLYEGSTTAAHEYGHTLGLDHPADLDIRGQGQPGIMYPRGTLVDPEFQYDPLVPAGEKGGTMHPMYRRVRPQDIASLEIRQLEMNEKQGVLGDFSSIWHPDHKHLI